MSGKKAKEIRRVLQYDKNNCNSIQRRTYNVFKRHYTSTPSNYKARLIETLKNKY